MRERLILFAKRPVRGRVKTRLVPPLTTRQALELYRAFLEDQLRFVESLRSAERSVELCLDDGAWEPDGSLAAAARRLLRSAQGPGDLGDRMLRAFRRSAAAGCGATVIVGADAPTLPAERVEESFRVLRGTDAAVLVPAEDGGYTLIGMRRPHTVLFRDVPWGGERVLEVTRRRALGAAIELHELEGWYDIDQADDLDRLRTACGDPALRRRAPATFRYLEHRLDDPTEGPG